MRRILPWAVAVLLSAGPAAANEPQSKAPAAKKAPAKGKAPAAQARPTSLKCVGLYSETDGGYASSRTGGGAWTAIKVGDVIPPGAEILISVDRDWVELSPSDNPNAVFEVAGSESGKVTTTVEEILKGKPRLVSFPKASGDKPDPAFKDKVVVTQYLGRQIYADPGGDEKDVKYGDVLATGGKVAIIAINNTLTLMNDGGKVTTVIGPLKFDVEKVLKNEKLYKFLNVPR